MTEGCRVGPDEDDVGPADALLLNTPPCFRVSDVPYVTPRVRIEAGAKVRA